MTPRPPILRASFEGRCVLCGVDPARHDTATGGYCDRCYDETSRLIDPDHWDRAQARRKRQRRTVRAGGSQ